MTREEKIDFAMERVIWFEEHIKTTINILDRSVYQYQLNLWKRELTLLQIEQRTIETLEDIKQRIDEFKKQDYMLTMTLRSSEVEALQELLQIIGDLHD